MAGDGGAPSSKRQRTAEPGPPAAPVIAKGPATAPSAEITATTPAPPAAAECPHPVFFKGLCTSCGASEDRLMPQHGPHLDLRCLLLRLPGSAPSTSSESVSWNCVSLPLCRHIGFRVSGAEARRRADGDLVRLLRARKLLLVLDLDHTLLNSCRSRHPFSHSSPPLAAATATPHLPFTPLLLFSPQLPCAAHRCMQLDRMTAPVQVVKSCAC